jgi:hypothetical protein
MYWHLINYAQTITDIRQLFNYAETITDILLIMRRL